MFDSIVGYYGYNVALLLQDEIVDDQITLFKNKRPRESKLTRPGLVLRGVLLIGQISPQIV
jgi:hypothetical protein